MYMRFLTREGLMATNTAKLLRLPKAPKKLPPVITAEQAGNMLDGLPAMERPQVQRDLAMLELLYGAGLRVSELVGLNLPDIDYTEHWLRGAREGQEGAPGSVWWQSCQRS